MATFCALGLSATAGWAKAWEVSELGIRFETPEGFDKVPKEHRTSTLEIFNPKLNTELIVSGGHPEKLPLKTFADGFPDWAKVDSANIAHSQQLSAAPGSAVAFVIHNPRAQMVESIYVYVVPPKGLPFSLIASYPSEQREQTMVWLKALVGGLRYTL
ncbi:MAG: hypothetical protein WC314_26595 [Vulcanimicrobiota bacterium]